MDSFKGADTMTEQEQKAFTAMRQALERAKVWHSIKLHRELFVPEVIKPALAAAASVSHQKPETIPAPEGAGITSESAANAVKPQAHGEALPVEGSEASDNAIHAMLRERQWPSSSMNAARAGWRAARLFTHPQATEPAGWTGKTDIDAALIMLDRLDVRGEGDDLMVDEISRTLRKLAAAPEAKQ